MWMSKEQHVEGEEKVQADKLRVFYSYLVFIPTSFAQSEVKRHNPKETKSRKICTEDFSDTSKTDVGSLEFLCQHLAGDTGMELAVENPSCAGSEGPGNVLTTQLMYAYLSH